MKKLTITTRHHHHLPQMYTIMFWTNFDNLIVMGDIPDKRNKRCVSSYPNN